MKPGHRRLAARERAAGRDLQAPRERQAVRIDVKPLAPKPRRELARRRRGGDAQLARQPPGEGGVRAQRGRAISRLTEREHQLALRGLVQRIPRGETARPGEHRARVARLPRRANQRDGSIRALGGVAGAEIEHPLTVQPLEELAAAERQRRFRLPDRDELGKRAQVDP